MTTKLHLPGDRDYDLHRAAHSPTVDSRPAMIVEAMEPADIGLAVTTANDLDLPFAVQATGHGTWQPADHGVLLKTGNLSDVRIDPQRRIATVGPGARWGAVLSAAARYGLVGLAGSSPDVGVVGYTLGGGMGWLARRYGLAADSVLAAEVVTADGRTITATPDRHPDLFWALRGGGGNFGVVASLQFRLYPVSQVFTAVATYPIEAAAEVLDRYRGWAQAAPDSASTAVVLGGNGVVVKAMSTDLTGRALRPLWTAAGQVERRVSGFAEAKMGGVRALHQDFFHRLTDSDIATIIAAHRENGTTVEVRHWGGAIAAAVPDAGPAGHRSTPFSVTLDNPGSHLPTGIGAVFYNFLGDPSRVDDAFTTQNLGRLREVKRAYDPTNFFHINHNITPAPAAAALAAVTT
ncbi:MAG: FAD-binding protein [Micromonosporaceae bacterium]|nr:FAD-binding protein [Micromonosporaceae bacterium]